MVFSYNWNRIRRKNIIITSKLNRFFGTYILQQASNCHPQNEIAENNVEFVGFASCSMLLVEYSEKEFEATDYCKPAEILKAARRRSKQLHWYY